MAGEYVINTRGQWQDRPADYVYVGRPSKWGNPFTHQGDRRPTLASHFVATRAEAVARYEEWVRAQPHLMAALDELRGKVLGCWCAPLPCHADVLVKLLRETEGKRPCRRCGWWFAEGPTAMDRARFAVSECGACP